MNISLPRQLEDFVAQQVSSGRFKSRDEVVRTALRQMEESERHRELQSFEAAFREIDERSTAGEPTAHDLAEIDRVVKSVRAARRQRKAA